jgi:hypothetical protein
MDLAEVGCEGVDWIHLVDCCECSYEPSVCSGAGYVILQQNMYFFSRVSFVECSWHYCLQLRLLSGVEEESEIVRQQEKTLKSELTLLRSKLANCETELLQCKNKIR